MKNRGLLSVGCLLALLAWGHTALAQVSMGGQMNFSLNQHFALPVSFHDNVDILVANGFTVSMGGSVTGNGYTLYKRGGGRFWFQADNKNFGSDIVYLGKSDTVRLDGVFGQLVNDSIGYLHTGKIFSSPDSISFFHLHQHDTAIQTFAANGYNRTNRNLYIYHDTKSMLRLVRSSDSLAGTVHLANGGRLYIDGTYNASLLITDTSRMITGENSARATVKPDYADFANLAPNDSAIALSLSTLQIGGRAAPSLARITDGHVVLRDSSTLEIDVFSPKKAWHLSTGVHNSWQSASDSAFSDRLYLVEGNCYFREKSQITVNCDTAFLSFIACDTVFYLPVVMIDNGTIQGAENVTVNANLPAYQLTFAVGDGGANGTVAGWGYVKCKNTAASNIPPDIRVYVKPSTAGTIHLSSYIDSLSHEYTIKWHPSSAFIHDSKGSLDVSGWSIPQTMVYSYTVGNPSCSLHTAKAYVHSVGKYEKTKTVYICKEVPGSNKINLNRIFGMEAHSTASWTTQNDPLSATSGNISTYPTGRHAGAKIFDAVQAFVDAGAHAAYQHGSGNKKFEIQYTHGDITKTVILIVY